ncbi:MAG: hypothetical protein GY860_19940 [Desulfobacteraceae bacterium]|nr:hypothetical protein [Desulfobacteraceae bacterium]
MPKTDSIQVQLMAVFSFLGFDFYGNFETGKKEAKILAAAKNIALSRLLNNLGVGFPNALPDIILDTLAIEISSEKEFNLFGKISVSGLNKVFNLDRISFPLETLELRCEITPSRTYCAVHLEGLKDEHNEYLPFLNIPGFASLTVGVLKMEAEKSAGNVLEWKFSTSGNLDLVHVFNIDGTLTSTISKSEGWLQFIPNNTGVKIPIPQAGCVELGLSTLEISYDKADSWSISSESSLAYPAFSEALPKTIGEIFPRKIKTKFLASKKGITIKSDRLLNPLQVKLPDIDIVEGQPVDLGYLCLDASNLALTIGKEISLSADFGVGLPDVLNKLFGVTRTGEPKYRIFKCYDPEKQGNSLIQIRISAGTDGINAVLTSSPFEPVKLKQDHKDKTRIWCDLDLGAAGAVRFQLPVFSYSPKKGGFSANGGFEVTRELELPLTPFKSMLQQVRLTAMADSLPDSLPLSDLEILDDQDNFNTRVFIDMVQTVMPDDKIVKFVEQIASIISDNLNKLPDRFRHYMNIKIPDKFFFDVTVSTEGSVKFDISVKDGHPIKVLYPLITPPLVVLFGVELRSLSFGLGLGGSVALVKADMRIDMFDLATLGAALILPEKNTLPLPNPRNFQRTIIIDDLTLLIILATQVPIPVPVFYDELGIEYLGLEGVGFQTHIKFPLPEVNLTGLGKVLLDFIGFVSDPVAFMDPKALSKGEQLRFAVGNNYLKLPEYLGGALLGYKGKEVSLNSYEIIARFMNGIKKLSINELISAVPLQYRVGTEFIEFGPFKLGMKWLLTTLVEYRQGAYKELMGNGSQESLLKLISIQKKPPGSSATGLAHREKFELEEPEELEKGIVLFLNGNGAIEKWTSFTASFGLAASGSDGFKTGFSICGKIANTLDFALKGYVVIADSRNNTPFFLAGHSHLTFLNRCIFKGDIELSDKKLFLSGKLDLFPDNTALEVTGNIKGWISDPKDCNIPAIENQALSQPFYMCGKVKVSLFDLTLINANAVITSEELYIQGQMLGVAARLNVKTKGAQSFLYGELALVCFGLNVKAMVHIDQNKALVSGIINPIDLGFLKITGTDGVSPLTAALTLGKKHVIGMDIDGQVKLLGLKTKTHLSFLNSSVHFKTKGKIFNLFEADLELKGETLETLYVKAAFKNDFKNALTKGVTGCILSLNSDVKKGLQYAQKEVDQAQTQANLLLKEVKRQRRIVGKEHKATKANLENAKKELIRAREEVDKILKTIRYNEDLIKEYSKWSWQGKQPFRAYLPHPKAILIPGLKAVVIAEYAACGIATAALETAKAGVKIANSVVKLTPVDLDVRVSTPLALYAGATITLQNAKQMLEGLEAGTDAVSGAVNQAANFTKDLLCIESAGFEGALSAFTKKSLVNLKLSLTYMGKSQTLEMIFNLNDVLESANSFARSLLEGFQKTSPNQNQTT